MFLTKAMAMLGNAKKSAPTIPTGLVEYLFSNVLVSKPARNISLCSMHKWKKGNYFINKNKMFRE